eukprot:1139615-Rhodomonas_salina.1
MSPSPEFNLDLNPEPDAQTKGACTLGIRRKVVAPDVGPLQPHLLRLVKQRLTPGAQRSAPALRNPHPRARTVRLHPRELRHQRSSAGPQPGVHSAAA